jgi:hypothetical protein
MPNHALLVFVALCVALWSLMGFWLVFGFIAGFFQFYTLV